MAKNNTPEVKEQEKVQTKYDRKMEARRQQKIKEKREEKVTKTVAAVVGIALVAIIVISVAVSVINKNNALKGTYVKVGDHDLTQVEYDYYYQTTVNNYLTNYASILPYLGLDTTIDFDKQDYLDGMTWKDMFDQMTVDQIKQNKAMVDDAQKAGFSYDTTEDYANFVSGVEQSASAAGVSVKEYYKESFGTYATEKNMEAFVKESIIAGAYYDHLLELKAPAAEEIKAYYEENTQTYDKVDYRSFTFNAELADDATEEEITKAMDELEEKADAMMQARQDGGDFEELCIENASEDVKANYEDAETEYSLSEGRYYASITAAMADWLYEEGRTEGDITVIRDDDSKACYVVEFINRYYDEADDARISSTLASQNVSEYINGLVENYQVVDVKGDLKYLTITTEDSAEETTEEPEETEAATADTEDEAATGEGTDTETDETAQ